MRSLRLWLSVVLAIATAAGPTAADCPPTPLPNQVLFTTLPGGDLDLGWNGSAHDGPGLPGVVGDLMLTNCNVAGNCVVATSGRARTALAPPLSVVVPIPLCVVNVLRDEMRGRMNVCTGALETDVSFDASLYQNLCPVCTAARTCSAGIKGGQACTAPPGQTDVACPPNALCLQGVCVGGTAGRDGQACMRTSDCCANRNCAGVTGIASQPASGILVGMLPTSWMPLTTGASQLVPAPRQPRKLPCVGQTQADNCGSTDTTDECTGPPAAGDRDGRGGTCGPASITPRAPCFEYPVTRVGTPGLPDASVAATFCVGATTSILVNQGIGLPGPGAILQPVTTQLLRQTQPCGNGAPDPDEECDDGNDVCGDGCDPNCKVSSCGNDFTCVTAGEQCDDGGTAGGDCCSATCQLEASGSPCASDGNPCTDDVCDSEGLCGGGQPSGPMPCSDDNACTTGDVCGDGVCFGEPRDCGDTDPCTADGCNEVTGCIHTPIFGCRVCTDPAECDDSNPCTSDTCGGGVCSNTPAPSGTPCPDGNACNGEEACGSFGQCSANPAPDCDDGEPCTIDSCNAALGCQHVAVGNGLPCADNDLCDGAETCLDGRCAVGAPLACDDGNPCTVGSCNRRLGCRQTPVSDGAPCGAGDRCTGGDFCQAGICTPGTGVPIECDDGDACTNDGCEPVRGCVHTPVADCVPLFDRAAGQCQAMIARRGGWYAALAQRQFVTCLNRVLGIGAGVRPGAAASDVCRDRIDPQNAGSALSRARARARLGMLARCQNLAPAQVRSPCADTAATIDEVVDCVLDHHLGKIQEVIAAEYRDVCVLLRVVGLGAAFQVACAGP
jgi:cysteine-rich repeat protein